MTKTPRKTLSIKLSEAEYKRFVDLAAAEGCASVSEFVKKRCLAEATPVQMHMDLADIKNVLSNVLLGEKVLSARMDSFFKSISTRMTEKNPKAMTKEERTETEERTARTYETCAKQALEKTYAHYAAGGEDPLYLAQFGDLMESRKG